MSSNLDELVSRQAEVGSEIQRLITNLGKEPLARRTKEQYNSRLQALDRLWDEFEATDNIIRSDHAHDLAHEYFSNGHYDAVLEKYNEIRNHILEKLTSLEGKEFSTMTAESQQSKKPAIATRGAPQSNTCASEASKLLRRHIVSVEAIQRLLNGLNERSDSTPPSKAFYEININSLNKHWSQLEELHRQIREIDCNLVALGYDMDEYLFLEEAVQTQLIHLVTKLEATNSSFAVPPPVTASTTMLNLPRFTLPTFDGDYLHWTQFRDLFTELVNNQQIPNCQKMFYLKTSLKGEAEKLIRHFTTSDANYNAAWKVITDRYENTRLLVTTLINKLLSQPTIQTEGSSMVKGLYDTTNECLLSLQNIGVQTENWDPLLLHILVQKLDRNTHTLWEQSLKQPKSLPSLKEFLAFLETRFQSLEALGAKSRKINTDAYKRSLSRVLSSSSSPAPGCTCCKGEHELFYCQKFARLSPTKRISLVKNSNLCLNCLKGGHYTSICTAGSCKKCAKRHHTMLHIDVAESKSRDPNTSLTAEGSLRHVPTKSAATPKPASALMAKEPPNKRTYVLLSTAIVTVIGPEGKEIECRALLDTGSQLNFISGTLARKLSLYQHEEAVNFEGISQNKQRANYRTSLTIKSRINDFKLHLEAIVLPRITGQHPSYHLDISGWTIPKNIKLADPQFYSPDRVDLLIGMEHFFSLMSIGQIKIGKGLPTLQKTIFGWVIGGPTGQFEDLQNLACGISTLTEEHLSRQVEQFWSLEEPEPKSQNMTSTELKCESFFIQTTTKDTKGRFIVRLPFSKETGLLGDSKDSAISRLKSLERKLMANPDLRQQYNKFMEDYERLGHMEEVDFRKISEPYFFLPHHGVFKQGNTERKLRVVFDASAKTSSNYSLNDLLHTGPKLQQELFSVLLRFRFPRFVFTSDIEKMYRQVLIHEEDRKYQMILWRPDPSHPIRCYRLNTVTYGITSSPYLAIKCLHRLAEENMQQQPIGSTSLLQDFYVDDLMTGSDSLRDALYKQEQLTQLLNSSGFKLRKWCANHEALLRNIPMEDRAVQLEVLCQDEVKVKTLGLMWNPKTDQFHITTTPLLGLKQRITKRQVLSDTASLFDPLGFLSPVIVRAKIFLQQLWTLKLDWDASLPMYLHEMWTQYRQELEELNNIKLDRHVFCGKTFQNPQLHVFSDASEKAYGAAIYVRSAHSDGSITIRLLCAKSRVAPTKATSLARLELCAAKLASQLAQRVQHDLQWKNPVFYWSDSEIILAWINSPSRSYHTFVANRVAAIQEATDPSQWRHVPSSQNPADLVSRGLSPRALITATTWFYGPLFLHGPETTWPPVVKNYETELEKRQERFSLAATTESRLTHFINSIDHRNSFKHLQRVTAYVIRFSECCKKTNSHTSKILTTNEMEAAMKVIVKYTQEAEFKEDIQHLKKYGSLTSTSPLLGLSPFLDEDSLLRVGGRLEQSSMPYNSKHPLLLPYTGVITKLIITDIHIANMHIGPQTLLAITRQQFWPIKGKTVARSIVQKCVRCTRAKPKLLSQLMGNLPSTRVEPTRPFLNSGVDFCGPFWTHFRIRGKRPLKTYVAIFCCFATKAVHIEVVNDLTTDAFIGALKRFISRRGHCKQLYCDNATNFLGAHNQLSELQDTVYSSSAQEKILKFCSTKGINFSFIPPRAPHFGGLWEAAVKSAKNLFRRSIRNTSLTYEELETVMVEIEGILNSRPLTPLSVDPNDLAALTPGHFLIGESLSTIVDPHAQPFSGNLRHRWQVVSQLKQEFWDRWRKEYITELQHRSKWKVRHQNIEPGTLVIIKEDHVPSMAWPLGRVLQTIPGEDGVVRVADVKTSSGILRRTIHRLAPLPVELEPVIEDKPINQPNDITDEDQKVSINEPDRVDDRPPKSKRPRTASTLNHIQKSSRLSY